MGATRSQPNLSGRVAPRHPPRLGDWQVRPDGTALQFVLDGDVVGVFVGAPVPSPTPTPTTTA